MDDTTTAVNNADQTTASDSATTQETTSASVETSTNTEGAETTKSQEDSKYVPYDRFEAVNSELKEIKAKLKEQESTRTTATEAPAADPKVVQQQEQIKQVLKQMGFVSQEDIAQEKRNQAVDAQLSSLEKELDGSDGRPKFDRKAVIDFVLSEREKGRYISDPKDAYKMMHEADLINWHVQQAVKNGQGIRTESSNGSGNASASGVSDDELRNKMATDPNAKQTRLNRIVSKLG